MPNIGTPEERAAIQSMLMVYNHAVDRRDWELMGSCYHDDGTCDYGYFSGPWQVNVDVAKSGANCLDIAHHQLGPSLIAMHAAHADVETYFNAYLRVRADAPPDGGFPGTGTPYDVFLGGRYIDRFESRDGIWKIAHRIGRFDWRRIEAAADQGFFETSADTRGASDRTDHAHRLGDFFRS